MKKSLSLKKNHPKIYSIPNKASLFFTVYVGDKIQLKISLRNKNMISAVQMIGGGGSITIDPKVLFLKLLGPEEF